METSFLCVNEADSYTFPQQHNYGEYVEWKNFETAIKVTGHNSEHFLCRYERPYSLRQILKFLHFFLIITILSTLLQFIPLDILRLILITYDRTN
jgi:dolichol kinase